MVKVNWVRTTNQTRAMQIWVWLATILPSSSSVVAP
jgi:hypothetical protein